MSVRTALYHWWLRLSTGHAGNRGCLTLSATSRDSLTFSEVTARDGLAFATVTSRDGLTMLVAARDGLPRFSSMLGVSDSRPRGQRWPLPRVGSRLLRPGSVDGVSRPPVPRQPSPPPDRPPANSRLRPRDRASGGQPATPRSERDAIDRWSAWYLRRRAVTRFRLRHYRPATIG